MILFGPGGWFAPFFAARGIQIIFALPSMVLVTIFICIPFVDPRGRAGPRGARDRRGGRGADARRLGRGRRFFRVTLPNIRWALLYGVALTTARAIGEIGAVLIVSGAIQGRTETATLYIFRAVEERQTAAGLRRRAGARRGSRSCCSWRSNSLKRRISQERKGAE